MSQLLWDRLILDIRAVGPCDFALEAKLIYVKERAAFGGRVMGFQNTRFKLAEANTKLEITPAFIDSCLEKHLAGNLNTATASMAKWWDTQFQCEIVDECLQLHGDYGYMVDYSISRLYLAARPQNNRWY